MAERAFQPRRGCRVAAAGALTVAGLFAAPVPAHAQSSCGQVPTGYNLIESNAKIIDGTPGPDFICAGDAENRIDGGEGDDIIYGMGSRDRISAGPGDDTVYGGAGDDRIAGQRGDDLLFGEAGADRIKGSRGHDTIDAGPNDDRVFGGTGEDEIEGGAGSDEISGGGGRDLIRGGAGNDEINGQKAPDVLHGDAGDDIVRGGPANDELHGGADSDTLDGGNGRDTCSTGEGAFTSCERQPGILQPLTVSPSGEPPDRDMQDDFSMSSDGRTVTFISRANNLVADDQFGGYDGYVVDVADRYTSLVAVSSDGDQPNDHIEQLLISGDGSTVVFTTKADNLVPGDTNGRHDIFVRDLNTETTTRISVSSTGAQANKKSFNPSISADGRYVVFESNASSLVPEKTSSSWEVMLHDRQTGRTTRIIEGTAISELDFSDPVISADGSTIAAAMQSADGSSDAFVVLDRATGARQELDFGIEPHLNADGSILLFRANKDYLGSSPHPSYLDGKGEVFEHNLLTGETSVLSQSTDGKTGEQSSRHNQMSPNGRFVTMWSANQLDPMNDSVRSNLFLRDRMEQTTTKVMTTTHHSHFNDIPAYLGGGLPAPDGSYVIVGAAFHDTETQLFKLDLP